MGERGRWRERRQRKKNVEEREGVRERNKDDTEKERGREGRKGGGERRGFCSIMRSFASEHRII